MTLYSCHQSLIVYDSKIVFFFEVGLDPNKGRFEGTGNDVKLKKIETEKNALFVISNYSAANTTDIIYGAETAESEQIFSFGTVFVLRIASYIL